MKNFCAITVAIIFIGLSSSSVVAADVDVKLWRLECGSFPNFPMDVLSDDDRYRGQRRDLANGCYVVRHGSDYLLWDAGLPIAPKGTAKRTIVSQLAQIGVTPDQIRYLAISHLHPDHIAQAADFPKATLLIGAEDWESVKSPPAWLDTGSLNTWIKGDSRVETVSNDPITSYDKDVFSDGSVRMIATPGHTPGHHSLMILLRKKGVVMLSGDLFHVRESYEHDVVPTENFDRAQTVASIDRFKRLAARYRATVVIQHDAGDIARLPAFPRAAD